MIARVSYLLLLLSLLGWLTGCAEKARIKTVTVDTRRLEVSFTERAETVLRKEYPVAMPVSGRIERIDLEVGDHVSKGEVLVRIDQIPARQEVEARQAAVESTRSRQSLTFDTSVEEAEIAQTRTQVETVTARISALDPAIDAASTALDNARRELDRVTRLVAGGALPRQREEDARLALEQAQAALSARESEKSALHSELAQARTVVLSAQARLQRKLDEAQAQSANIVEAATRKQQAEYTLEKSTVTSPIEGLVLSRLERGPKELAAGSPLLSLGRLEDLEVECDVLSQDALRIARGTTVLLDPGNENSAELKGEVRLKEPQGFTKRSSLGVEQQRVKVMISLLNPPRDLGVGYELWARFLVQQKTALTLPQSCFLRTREGYDVWKVGTGSKLQRVSVEVGTKGDQLWEVVGTKLAAGDRIVATPGEELVEGDEIEAIE